MEDGMCEPYLPSMPGTADNNELAGDYKDHLLKFVPVLESYDLKDAAAYFREWVSGSRDPAPLLDVSALQKNVVDAGGFQVYMEKTFDSEARTYATEFRQGPLFLRPWMLGWRNDFGYSGACEPDEYLGLAELIIQEGSLGEAKLFIERLCSDWDKLPSNMRKSLSLREAISLHQSCALFLHFLKLLEVSIPSSEFPAAKEKVFATFNLGVLDSDLITAGEKSVPPGDIKALGAFRTGSVQTCLLNILAARETQEMQEREDQAKELAMKVAQATLAQIRSQFEGDMQNIRAKLPSKDAQTVETAKDMKLVLCSVDATVWPSSTQYMMDCLGLMQNVCSLGPGNMALIQQPLFHQATTMNALIKHRRRLEDFLLKSDLDISNTVTLTFSKDASMSSDKRKSDLDISNTVTLTFSKDASMSSDKRAMTQSCYCLLSSKTCRWLESDPLITSVLGPLPRLRGSDMQGYDPETGSRPGAAARIEQNLVLLCNVLPQELLGILKYKEHTACLISLSAFQ
eukprot:s6_g47.t1